MAQRRPQSFPTISIPAMKAPKRMRSSPAFAGSGSANLSSSISHNSLLRARTCAPRRHAVLASAAPIPGSLSDACAQARDAVTAALSAGKRRLFVEIDTTGGDETYTLLKNSLPVARDVVPGLLRPDGGRVPVLLPDSGAAALFVRDWARAGVEVPASLAVMGLEEIALEPETDAGVAIVVPRASDVDRMERIVASAGDLPVLVVNPDLIDMGVTGLSLNARQLRTRLIDSFESAYYLKVFGWGVVLRAYPGKWGLWVDDPGSPVGFRLVAELDECPSTADIEDALDGTEGATAQGPLQSFLSNFSRFLKVYTKG